MMVVVNGATECKRDCMVASVSAFVAPRGSSTSKFFNTACLAIAISGFFGSLRWYQVKDATYAQFILSAYGHMALLLVAVFEYDGMSVCVCVCVCMCVCTYVYMCVRTCDWSANKKV